MNNELIRRGALESVAEKLLLGIAEPLDLIRAIMRAPAVDAVEVVRCRDCRMAALLRKPTDKVIADCMLRKMHTDDEDFIEVGADDFCSCGVRREDDA